MKRTVRVLVAIAAVVGLGFGVTALSRAYTQQTPVGTHPKHAHDNTDEDHARADDHEHGHEEHVHDEDRHEEHGS